MSWNSYFNTPFVRTLHNLSFVSVTELEDCHEVFTGYFETCAECLKRSTVQTVHGKEANQAKPPDDQLNCSCNKLVRNNWTVSNSMFKRVKEQLKEFVSNGWDVTNDGLQYLNFPQSVYDL